MVAFLQPSFAKGEIAPALYGRVDTAAYQVAVRRGRNMLFHAYGGASNRPGLIYIGPVKDHGATPRLIEFRYKASDTYILVFQNQSLRIIRNDGFVTETSKAISGISTGAITTIQSNAHGFSDGDEVFIANCLGRVQINNRHYIVANATANTFDIKDQVDPTQDVNSVTWGLYSGSGTVARLYTVPSPYALADLKELKFTQSADVMTIAHKNYPVHELSRTGHANWTFSEVLMEPNIAFPRDIVVAVNGAPGAVKATYTVTAIAKETFEESLPGLNLGSVVVTGATNANPVEITAVAHGYTTGQVIYHEGMLGMTELNGRRFVITTTGANTYTLDDEDGTNYGVYTSNGNSFQTFVTIANSNATADNKITWDAVPGALKYYIYKAVNGLFGFIGESLELEFDDKNKLPDLDISVPQARDPFRTVGTYPGTVGYYEQRRQFGGSSNKPDTNYWSQTGNHSNFNTSTPLRQDDAITATLSSREVNEIRHYIEGNDLLVLTSGSEWKVTSGSDVAFASDTLRQKPQSRWGSSHLRPLTIGLISLYVQENKSVVRTIGYSLQEDGYTGSDVTVLASHIFQDYTLEDWAFARHPDPVVHGVRSDGTATCLTFQQEQQVSAWATWDTAGKFEAVASTRPTASDTGDAAYFAVRRRINGYNVCYIERTHDRRFVDVRDGFFVDAGASYNDPKMITSVGSGGTITCPAHGFSNGDLIDLSSIEWFPVYDANDNLITPNGANNKRFTISGVTANTFNVTFASGDYPTSGYFQGGFARKAVSQFWGLIQLRNTAVSILADGNVVSGKTVTQDGGLTLDVPASRVHVGIKYISDLETLNVEMPVQGTIQNRKKKINKVTMRFEKTRGVLVGPSWDKLTQIKDRSLEPMGLPTQPLTGDRTVDFKPEWSTAGRTCLRQRYPLPMTLLAIMPDIDASDG